MVDKVKADVVATFQKDTKAKEAALAAAVAVLQGGAKGKMGKDVVGEIFSKSIANYAAEYKKQPEGSDEIIKKLEADANATIGAITVLTELIQGATSGNTESDEG